MWVVKVQTLIITQGKDVLSRMTVRGGKEVWPEDSTLQIIQGGVAGAGMLIRSGGGSRVTCSGYGDPFPIHANRSFYAVHDSRFASCELRLLCVSDESTVLESEVRASGGIGGAYTPLYLNSIVFPLNA